MGRYRIGRRVLMMFSRPRSISQSIVRRKLAHSSTTRLSACLAPESRVCRRHHRTTITGRDHDDPVYRRRPARSGLGPVRHRTAARSWAPEPHAHPLPTLRPPRCGSCGGGRSGRRAVRSRRAREVGCPRPARLVSGSARSAGGRVRAGSCATSRNAITPYNETNDFPVFTSCI